MLIQSSLLLWIVTYVLLLGPETNAIDCVENDDDTCPFVSIKSCEQKQIKDKCPNACKKLDCVCNPPWQYLDEKCFKVINEQRTWSSARAYCNNEVQDTTNIAADLAVPKNIKDLYEKILKDKAKYPKGNYWIGGSNLFNQGEWHWINPNTITDLPAYQKHADECVYVDNNDADVAPENHAGHEGCGATLPFVCEKFFK